MPKILVRQLPGLPDLFRRHYYSGFIDSESTWVCTTLYIMLVFMHAVEGGSYLEKLCFGCKQLVTVSALNL